MWIYSLCELVVCKKCIYEKPDISCIYALSVQYCASFFKLDFLIEIKCKIYFWWKRNTVKNLEKLDMSFRKNDCDAKKLDAFTKQYVFRSLLLTQLRIPEHIPL